MEKFLASGLYSSFIISNTSLNKSMEPNVDGSHGYKQDHCAIARAENAGTIVFVIVMVLILIASVTGNMLVTLGFALSSTLRKRVTNYVIVSLAASDMLYALMVLPFLISMKLHHGKFCHGKAACYFLQITDVICNVASILNLFLIALDRYVAIRLPYRYHVLTKSRVLKLILVVWLLAVCWSFSGLFKWSDNDTLTTNNTQEIQKSVFSVELNVELHCRNPNYYFFTVSYIAIYLVPLTVMTITYALVLQTAISHIRAIEKNNASVSFRNRNNNVKDHKNRSRAQKKELKATKSVAIVYFAFVLCWFPNCVINIIAAFDNNHFKNLNESNPDLFAFINYCLIQIFPMVNTMLNPIIYSFSSKQFRKAFKKVFDVILERCCISKFSETKGARSQSEISTRSSVCSSSLEIKALNDIGNNNGTNINGSTTRL